MKTNLHTADSYKISNRQETIAWILGSLVFIRLLLGFTLNAQTQEPSLQDTIWLRSGEIIPCIITNEIHNATVLAIIYVDETGNYFQKNYQLFKVSKFKKTSEAGDFDTWPEVAEYPKYAKVFLGVGGGLPSNGGVSVNVLLASDFGASISYKSFSLKSKNLPPDYKGGIFYIWGPPTDNLTIYSACFVKAFPSNTRLVRFSAEAGPSWVVYSEVQFNNTSSYLFGPNYYATRSSQNTIGLTLRGRLEFPLAQFTGLEFAAIININKYRSVVGFECYLTLGRVRDRLKNKQ